MSEKLSESQAYKQVISLFGEDNVFHPEDTQRAEFVSSGSPELDWAMAGGWPLGRIIQLAGAPASGKTFLALLAMAKWQALDPENCVAFLDAEYTYDPVWAASVGVDNNRVFYVKSNDASKLFQGLVGKKKKNKTTGVVKPILGLLGMAAEGMTIAGKDPNGRTRSFDLSKLGVVVLDSVASLLVPIEAESDAGKVNVAPVARFLSVELRKLTPEVAQANVAMFVINQLRVKIGEYGNPTGSPGGKALVHACSLMVNFTAKTKKELTIFDEMGEKIGHQMVARVEKHKLSPPGKSAEFFVKFDEGVVNKGEELFRLGEKINLFGKETPKSRTRHFNGEKFTDKDSIIEYLNQNADELEGGILSSVMEFQFSPQENNQNIEKNPFDDEDEE